MSLWERPNAHSSLRLRPPSLNTGGGLDLKAKPAECQHYIHTRPLESFLHSEMPFSMVSYWTPANASYYSMQSFLNIPSLVAHYVLVSNSRDLSISIDKVLKEMKSLADRMDELQNSCNQS